MSALAGTVAVVTGASRGIGLAVAERLRAEGATVARLARTLRAAWRDGVLDLPCDLTQDEDVRHAAERIIAQLGVPDIVVSNAGAFLLASLEQTRPADFDAQLGANLRAPFLVARAFLPAMRERGRGSTSPSGASRITGGSPRTPPMRPPSLACAASTRCWSRSSAGPECAAP